MSTTHEFTLTAPQVDHDYHEMVCSCGASARSVEYPQDLQEWKREHLLFVHLEETM